MLDAACPPDGRRGLWMLDGIMIFFDLSSIKHPESSICLTQGKRYLLRQFVGLPWREAIVSLNNASGS